MKDKIYTSIPINKLAAKVAGSQPNDETIQNYGQIYMSLERPPIVPFHSRSNSKYLNLHGLKFGKLTVVGVFIKQTHRKKLKWVVQCKCGYYTIRISPTIRRKVKNNEYDECARCGYLTRSKRNL